MSRKIEDNSCNIERELINRIKISEGFAMQLESTEVAGLSVLFVFTRYMHNNQAEEQMLVCKPFRAHTREKVFSS
jgi:hypothetical protein